MPETGSDDLAGPGEMSSFLAPVRCCSVFVLPRDSAICKHKVAGIEAGATRIVFTGNRSGICRVPPPQPFIRANSRSASAAPSAGVAPASTSLCISQGVDGRVKPGHDDLLGIL